MKNMSLIQALRWRIIIFAEYCWQSIVSSHPGLHIEDNVLHLTEIVLCNELHLNVEDVFHSLFRSFLFLRKLEDPESDIDIDALSWFQWDWCWGHCVSICGPRAYCAFYCGSQVVGESDCLYICLWPKHCPSLSSARLWDRLPATCKVYQMHVHNTKDIWRPLSCIEESR